MMKQNPPLFGALRATLLACAAIACAATLGACATGGGSSTGRGGVDPIAKLERAAERESRRPDSRAMQTAPPPGVDSALLERVADDGRTYLSLDDALAVVLQPTDEEPGDDIEEPTFSSEALRLYVRGRSHRLSGEHTEAIRDLEAATRLDPGASAPWRELGEAYLASGDRLSSGAAFAQAIQRDPEDVRSLERVGRVLYERRQHESAAKLLGRAWQLREDNDPALPYVVGLPLGRSLHDLGFLAAGNEAISTAIRLPERFGEPTIYRIELADIYRVQGDAWRDVGDAALRLGDDEQALAAFDRAAALPSLDPGALTPRRVYSAMRLGRPSEAALIVIDEIIRSRGAVEDRHLRLIEYLNATTRVGPGIAGALDRIAEELTPEERRLAESALVRAQAAALDDAEAREMLRRRLLVAPDDQMALTDLYRRIGRANTGRLIDETELLIEAAPFRVSSHVESLLLVEPDSQALLTAIEEQESERTPELAMLEARIYLSTNDTERAVEILRRLLEVEPDFGPGIIEIASALIEAGADNEASEWLMRLETDEREGLQLARARLLYSLQQFDEAFAAISPFLPSSSASDPAAAHVAILASDIAFAMRRWGESEQWRLLAVEIDPSLEAGYAGLIHLYGPRGPLANAARLGETVRRLRDSIPSSKTLRWLRAQEFVRTGQLDRAERDLLSLAEEAPTEPIVELLVRIWLRTGSEERAETWLREKIANTSYDRLMTLQLADVLLEREKAEEAADLLRAWLVRRPGDVRASRRLETVLREGLGLVEQADNMALDRLVRSPDSADTSLETAQIYIRRGNLRQAADVLENAVRLEPELLESQQELLARLAMSLGARAIEGALPLQRAIDLYERVEDHIGEPPVGFLLGRAALLVLVGAEFGRIDEAVHDAVRAYPDVAPTIVARTAAQLRQRFRNTDALRLLEQGGARLEDANEELLFLWITTAAAVGDVESVDQALTRMFEFGATKRIVETITDQKFGSENQAAAALAYWLAGDVLDATGEEESADRMYRLALRFDSRHAMANNNLGYRMAERGENLEEAHRLLRIAYAVEPNSAAIIDSLGWVRYRLGLIDDRRNENGVVIEEGARSLLARAASLREGREDATVQDHLGDVYWIGGDQAKARERWVVARSLLQARAAQRGRLSELDEELLRSLEGKIAAVDAGQEPAVAEVIGGAEEERVANDAAGDDSKKN